MSSSKEKLKKRVFENNMQKAKNPKNTMVKNKNKRLLIIISVLVIMIIALLFSVIFALVQGGKNTIVNGVCVKGIELSGCTTAEAKEKLKEQVEKELKIPFQLIYGEYKLDVNVSELEFEYNYDKAVEEAFKIGRKDGLISNNYAILGSLISGKQLNMEYKINDVALESIVETIDSNLPGKVKGISYDIDESSLIITPGEGGIKLDVDKLKEKLIEKIISRNSRIQTEKQIINIPVVNCAAEKIDIEKIYKEVYCEPQDAYLVEEPFELKKDVDGVDFAITIDEAKKLLEETKAEYIIPLKITPAKVKVADLGDQVFHDVLATYSTNYDAGYTARSTNLRLAANKINGLVLLPGEEFSFNKVVGKRTVEDGYQNAPIYENGKVVDGLAGGICQISSTLYNAVLFANLDIVERRNHNFTSTYVPAGRDATVVYGSIDFKFKNSRKYPIKIEASVSGGVAKFVIKGLKEEVEYKVDIYTQTTGQTPFAEEIQEDPSVPAGTRQVAQGGHNGQKVSSYRALSLDGKEISRTLLYNDTYLAMARIIKVAPGEGNQEQPSVEEVIDNIVENNQPVPESNNNSNNNPAPNNPVQNKPAQNKPTSSNSGTSTVNKTPATTNTTTNKNTTTVNKTNTTTTNVNKTPTAPTTQTTNTNVNKNTITTNTNTVNTNTTNNTNTIVTPTPKPEESKPTNNDPEPTPPSNPEPETPSNPEPETPSTNESEESNNSSTETTENNDSGNSETSEESATE